MTEQYDRLHIHQATCQQEINDALEERMRWLRAILIGIGDGDDPHYMKSLAELALELTDQVDTLTSRAPTEGNREKAERERREQEESLRSV